MLNKSNFKFSFLNIFKLPVYIKYTVALLCCISYIMVGSAQDYIDKKEMIIQDTSISIQEKLVQLALLGPTYDATLHQNKINEYELKRTKNAWLNILSLSVSYNEQSFSKNLQGPNVYPKYFFGLTIPLGTLFSKTEIKSAKEQIELGKDNQEQLVRNLKADILTKYRQYLAYTEQIIIQTQIADDAHALFLQVEKKFKERDKSITIDDYAMASRSSNSELTRKMELQLQKDLIEIEIERIIGTNLESVLNK